MRLPMSRLFDALLCAIALTICGMACAAPALRVSEPLEGYVIDDSQVDVWGTFAASPGVGVTVTVNGIRASLFDDRFLVSGVPLAPGMNVLVVAASDGSGTTTEVSQVWSTGPSPLRLKVAGLTGLAPLSVAITVEDGLARSIARIDADFDGDGNMDASTNAGTVLNHIYSQPGHHFVRVVVTFSSGEAVLRDKSVVARDPLATDAQLKTIWNRFSSALADGDKAQALQLMTEPARIKYEPVFDALLPNLATVMPSFSPIEKVALFAQLGEYAVSRTLDGTDRLFFVHFLLGADGQWRLDEL